ncbi:Oxygen regulatory protein NreC [bacterium HR17]|jgi:two-component system response regulator NreC|uniref:Oxygen regulatory protein NreC n=1 Tax=Candidatus Fervidibacter japonicus TaxID=2035412 RepID=A0A2H5XEN6_9BACT|nr:Oxygen regulatory protein NreC [bacterium HR17]
MRRANNALSQPLDRIRVLIADDHAILRDGLKALLAAETDMEVVGEAATGKEALRLVRELKPHVVLMDISMPDMTGLEATEVIKKSYPEVKVIALTVHEHETYLRRMLQVGADGYVVKRAAADELVRAIRAVMRGGVYLQPELAQTVVKKRTEQSMPKLSEREWQVLRLLAMGYTNQQIAQRLFLSVKTVETYRSRIADKLGLKTRAELVKFALQHNLLAEEPDP